MGNSLIRLTSTGNFVYGKMLYGCHHQHKLPLNTGAWPESSIGTMGYLKKKKLFSASNIYVRLTSGCKKVDNDRARKGYVPVLVGQEKMMMERILLPTKLIDHPYIVALLELSAKEFGYQQQGLLQIPYDADCFKRMVEIISKERQILINRIGISTRKLQLVGCMHSI